ncbi:MAG: outer membrane beta-barrel protein [Acidobacteriaceae bacterium]|nr:outer membrane beta-barrel protein [Acidobacteriaceae bacterium]
MKLLRGSIPLLCLLCFGVTLANAQNGLDAYFGVGTAQAPSSGQSLQTFGTSQTFTTPTLNGTFGKLGADLMFTPHFGVGGAADWRFSQAPYAGLNYRPTFYDFYGIWEPTTRLKRVVPQFVGGLGATHLSFYLPQSSCNAFTGCSSSSTLVTSANHFQTHIGFGLGFYATQHVFFRPQIDAHWVDNFFQFGSNWVPEYSLSVGYRFGEH